MLWDVTESHWGLKRARVRERCPSAEGGVALVHGELGVPVSESVAGPLVLVSSLFFSILSFENI